MMPFSVCSRPMTSEGDASLSFGSASILRLPRETRCIAVRDAKDIISNAATLREGSESSCGLNRFRRYNNGGGLAGSEEVRDV